MDKLIGVSLTEEMILNDAAIPEYMKGCRRFRIEYINSEGHSNFEGTVYLPNINSMFEWVEDLESLLQEAWNLK